MSVRIKSEQVDNGALASMSGDDEVVREIDVYISPALAHQMYLVQFPLQHHVAPLPDDARIRPNHGVVELDQALPTNIGREGGFFLPKRTFESHTIPISTHMAIGRIKDDAIHLTPLNHILQMRPNFAHVDETMNPSEPDEVPIETSKEKKPLMFQKKESDRTNMARKSSYAYKKASEESEEWIVLLTHGPASDEYKGALTKATEGPANSLATGDGVSFVQSLNYLPKNQEEKLDDDDRFVIHDEVPSEGKLVQRLITLLVRGWPVPYLVLRSQFTSVDDQDLLIALGCCSVLVRGNFCLQSRLLGLEPEVAHARTFVLLILQTHGFLSERRVNRVFDGTFVTPGWIRIILQQVAKLATNGWTLKLEDNHWFCDRFPEQSKLHIQYCDRQTIRFQDKLVMYGIV